jgi:hypothetical protein
MARKTKKELYEERRAARQDELLAARKDLINAIGYEGAPPEPVLLALTAALVVLRGAIRGSVIRANLRISLGPTNEGYTWPCEVYVPAADHVAAQIGAAVGYEVAVDEDGLRWRRGEAAADAVGAWGRWVDGYQQRFDRAAKDLASYAGPDGLRALTFDEGDKFEQLARAGVVLVEARGIADALAEAATRSDDLAVEAILTRLRDRCVAFLVAGSFRRCSSSAMNNEMALIKGDMLGKVADMAGAVAKDLRGGV